MRPVYLEFCGINSFSEKAVIDFRALLSGGVFGIFGDTGSGKSTILDCIHLALYGQMERSSGSECIHYHLDSAYVIFDFEITTDGERHTYRVKRERRRKNNTAKAYLYEYTSDGALFALAEGTRDVNERLEKIIGLTFADFKMCIALPQGDFAALVKAATAERVKLVSRLFDLEKYGEKLSRAVNDKYYKAEEEVNIIKAKMEQNECGEEVFAQTQEKIRSHKTALEKISESLKKAENAYERATLLQREKSEYDRLGKALREYLEKLPEMQKRREETEKLPSAKAVCRELDAVDSNEKEKRNALVQMERIQKERAEAVADLEKIKATAKEKNFENKIVALSVSLEKVRSSATELQAEQKAEADYRDALQKYKRIEKEIIKSDFDGIKARLETELSALGEDENLLDYLRHHCKTAFLGEAYAEFRKDLTALGEKYPQTQAEISSLITKYAWDDLEDTNLDIVKAQADFKTLEQKRKVLKERLQENERARLEWENAEQKKQFLKEQGIGYRKLWESLKEKNEQIRALGAEADLSAQLNRLKTEKQTIENQTEKMQNRINELRADEEKQKGLYEKCAQAEKTIALALKEAVEKSGFQSANEAKALYARLGDEAEARAECEKFFTDYQTTKRRFEEIDEVKFVGFDEEAVERAKAEKIAVSQARDDEQKALASCETELKRLLDLREKYKEFEKELAVKEKEKNLCDELRALVKNNRFLEFIASEYLQDICVAASKTLLSLTSGRYFLKYEKEFKVGDNLDGGKFRAVKTLSGGETFLVSLSLALSLSGAIFEKSLRPIEFFFLDEGFGTLDGNLVETVMDVLGKLSKNFAVGLISHVEELKHRVENKILVTGANERHGSLVRLERY